MLLFLFIWSFKMDLKKTTSYSSSANVTGSLCSAWPSIPAPTKRSGNCRVFKDDHVFWLSLVLAPIPPLYPSLSFPLAYMRLCLYWLKKQWGWSPFLTTAKWRCLLYQFLHQERTTMNMTQYNYACILCITFKEFSPYVYNSYIA